MVVGPVAALVPRPEIEGDMVMPPWVQARRCHRRYAVSERALSTRPRDPRHLHQPTRPEDRRVRQPETPHRRTGAQFYASVRLDVRRIQSIKVGEEVIGNRTRIMSPRTRSLPPFTAEFIMFNKGISKAG